MGFHHQRVYIHGTFWRNSKAKKNHYDPPIPDISYSCHQLNADSPRTPTTSLIFAASPALSLPFILTKNVSQAESASSSRANSDTQSAWILCQNLGSANVLWNAAEDTCGCGPEGGTSISASVIGVEFVWCPSISVEMVREGGAGLGGALERGDAGGAGAGVGADEAAGAEALSMRVRVAPSVILYSLTSFVSLNAFPLSKSRCESMEGADDDVFATRAFRSAMVSVGWAVIVNVRGGLRDLTTRFSASEVSCARVGCMAYL